MARRVVQVFMAVALVAVLLPVGPAPPAAAQAASRAATVSTSHPFSDPVWYPLRNSRLSDWVNKPARRGPWSALVSCVKTNCSHKHNDPHGTWAIDFVADRGDPIYAAGAGVMHVGGINGGCTSKSTRGSWVWIDHGGGVVSRYHHLSRIVARDGQLVTPRTKIGEVGSSGSPCGSGVDYLHFDVRRGGVNGDRFNPGQLRACRQGSGARLLLPADIGYESWDDIPHRVKGVPATESSCIPSSLPNTPDRPSTTSGRYGNRTASISWPGPSTSVNLVTVSMRIYRPSLGRWSDPEFVRLPGSARSHRFTNLLNGRWYMFRASYHNRAGNSAWSPERVVVPAARPTQPTKRRLVATRTRIGYAWNQSHDNGRDVTGYTVAIRGETSAGWTAWYPKKTQSSGTVHNWFDRTPNRTYQVRVRARSDAGPSIWSPRSTITTLR